MRFLSNVVCLLLIVAALGCAPDKRVAPDHRPVKIIAHRGVHKCVPENTLAAIRAAVKRKLDYVEMDVRTTADGHLVLMHDKTIDRTTTGSGPVNQLTLEQIRKVKVKTGKDSTCAGEKVPLLSEVLQYMRGKINAYVDIKDANPNFVFAELEKQKMLSDAVIYIYM